MHWILIIIVIAVILYWQIKFFIGTKTNLKIFTGIFPKDPDSFWTVLRVHKQNGTTTSISTKNEVEKKLLENECIKITNGINKLKGQHTDLLNNPFVADTTIKSLEQDIVSKENELKNKRNQIESIKPIVLNQVQLAIISAINSYLDKNQESASDFGLIKDIVDRNTDAVDDEIQTQIPFPLYLGLMGTMAGILIGVGYLVISGGLDQLINTVEIGSQQTSGIKALLGGVALAMICSIFGIVFTTIGSNKSKNSKAEVERNKHAFLSWLQAELLPVMNKDAVSAIRQVTDNLSQFNEVFSKNTTNLGKTLSSVNTATENQVRLLNEVNQLKPKKLAEANVEVYEKLKNCSDEIGRIGDALQNSAEYLAKVKELSNKLDENQELLRTIKEMTAFFKETREGMSGMISKSIGKSEDTLNDATQTFKENLEKSYIELNKAVSKHQDALEKSLLQENDTLQKRVNEFNTLVNEIKSLSAVKSSMDKLQKETEAQNQKIDKLSEEIKNLAQVKASGGSISTKLTLPKYAKVALYIVGGVLTLAGLLYVVLFVLGLFGIL